MADFYYYRKATTLKIESALSSLSLSLSSICLSVCFCSFFFLLFSFFPVMTVIQMMCLNKGLARVASESGVRVDVVRDLERVQIDLVSQQTSAAAETLAKLVSFLRLVRDEF